jgi:hypothetical protein
MRNVLPPESKKVQSILAYFNIVGGKGEWIFLDNDRKEDPWLTKQFSASQP